MNSIAVRIAVADTIAQNIRLLRLESLDGANLPAWDPGSHIDLHLGEGLIRQYSLCGPQRNSNCYEVAVKLEPESRGGSKFVHESLAAGSELRISVPRNHFAMAEQADMTYLVAAGIGITPIISMARALREKRRKFKLFYFARSPDHAAFMDELQDASLRESCRLLFGLERHEVDSVLSQALKDGCEGSHLYMCGPKPFMDTVHLVATRCKWREDHIHLEYFVNTKATEQSTQTSFEVKLARSGRTVTIPENRTIVDVLREEGIDTETSCEQGVCGTCVTRVLDGVPEHHDCFLTAQEQAKGDCMAVCVSRSRSRLLVLDL